LNDKYGNKVGLMMKKENQTINGQAGEENLEQQLEELELRLQEKQTKHATLQEKLAHYESEFSAGEKMFQSLKNTIKSTKAAVRAVPAYLLGRRNPKQLYSNKYKQKAAENKLKMYKKYLYDLGFEKRARKDLQDLYFQTEDPYLKSALALELGLYYANQLDKRTAPFTIQFLTTALGKRIGPERVRKLAVLLAEALELLGREKEATKLLMDLLDQETHPDLYLALANLEKTPEERLKWINHVLKGYDLQEVKLNEEVKRDAYYRLTTDPIQKRMEAKSPKVSVIIPAYNAESGIRIALDSLLNQTWSNIEILVIDDCSTDQTLDTVKSYTEKHNNVHLFSTEVNSGPYVARNIGLTHATGEFVTVNDADDWSHPEKIEIQVKHLLENPEVIANTSYHARLTEHLKPYRRSMPGKYIFSNMSSLLFRKEAVLEKIGYWDEVRFAADSEFKNRLKKAFGEDAVVDVPTGPLSFPMQSSNSLTASSSFGYAGFLMGVRKEYRESYGYFHEHAESLYMPRNPEKRLFPVPQPMLPNRTTNKGNTREVDVAIIADFRLEPEPYLIDQLKVLKKMGHQVGLVQMGTYDLKIKPATHTSIRELIDGNAIQLLVYGEKVYCNQVLIYNPAIFTEEQKYIPHLTAQFVDVVITEVPRKLAGDKEKEHYHIRKSSRAIDAYLQVKSKWYPLDETLRTELKETHRREIQSISLSTKNWLEETKTDRLFQQFIEKNIVDQHPLLLEGRDNGESTSKPS